MLPASCQFLRGIAFACVIAVAAAACEEQGRPLTDSPPKSAGAYGEASGLQWFERQQSVFHGIPAKTLFALPAQERNQVLGRELERKTWSVFDLVNRVFNAFDPRSELGRINAAGDQTAFVVSGDLRPVIAVALEAAAKSGGAFDPTLWPLKELWRKAERDQTLPGDAALKEAVARAGAGKLCLKGKRLVFEHPGMSLDFGGIVKGYAVDLIATELRKKGVENALVQCGGEIRAWGKNRQGGDWRLGIQHPLKPDELWGSVCGMKELSVSTSGNYRQPIKIGDMLYYHIFDPHSGRPISTDVLGVTVLMAGADRSNALADAWATAMAVLGPERGLALAKQNGFDVLFILKDKGADAALRSVMTQGFRRYYRPWKEE